jgi:transposase
MASGAKDIQFRELKDTISQLSITIRTQNDLITSLQKMLEDRNAKDDEKDRIISNRNCSIAST